MNNDDSTDNDEEHTNMSCFMVSETYINNNSRNDEKEQYNENNFSDKLIILDSGASCHMFNSNELMTEYRSVKNYIYKITGFNGTSESAVGIGDIGILKDVLYIPNIPNSIISTTALCNNGYSMFQSKNESYICNEVGDVIIRGTFNGKLWILGHNDLVKLINMNNTINTASSTRTDPLSILYYQYNHLSAERLRNLCKCYKFPGISNLHVKSFNHIKECEYCKFVIYKNSS